MRRKGSLPAYESFDRLTDAKCWVQDVESNMRAGRHSTKTEAKKGTLSDAIDRYIKEELIKKPKSVYQQGLQLKWFKEQVGYRLLIDVTPALLSEVKSKFINKEIRAGVKRKPQTWNRFHSAISRVLQMCAGEW